jgi:hypothetical protein
MTRVVSEPSSLEPATGSCLESGYVNPVHMLILNSCSKQKQMQHLPVVRRGASSQGSGRVVLICDCGIFLVRRNMNQEPQIQ